MTKQLGDAFALSWSGEENIVKLVVENVCSL